MAGDPATIIDQAQSYASGLLTTSESFIKDARSAIEAIPAVSLAYSPISIPNYNPITIPSAKIVEKVTLEIPDEPEAPRGLSDISKLNIDASAIPTLNAVLGSMINPSTPSPVGSFSGTIPSIDVNSIFPEVPSQLNTSLTLPVFTDHALPVAPSVVLPVFDKVAPIDLTTEPEDYAGALLSTFSELAPSISSAINGQVDAMIARFSPMHASQMGALEQKLNSCISGGTAVNSSVANAIYEQDKEKSAAEYKRTVASARSQAAKWGFTLPTGFVANAAQMARQGFADNSARASRDIAIKQFELEQQNVQFALTTSKELRLGILSSAMGYFNSLVSVNSLALDAGKSVMQSMVEAYNSLIKRYEISLEAYKTEASVYETNLRGAMSATELYKSEIQALESLTNVDRAKVEVFRSQVDSLQAYASIYKTKVDAVVSKAQLEKLKIDVFQAQVESYRAQISGKSMEWEAYKSALQSNETTSRIYGSQIDAYAKKVDAFKTVVQAKMEVTNSESKRNDEIIRQYEAKVGAFRTIVQARSEKARAEIDVNRQSLDVFKSELDAAIAQANSTAMYHKLLTETKITESDQRMKTQFKQADLWMEKAKAVAQVSEQLSGVLMSGAQGALNGINSIVSLAG